MTAMLDSLRPADSARSDETTQHRRPTSKDILAGGYNCQREIPEPVECEFCGRKLYHEALVMGRTVLMFAPFPQRCTCDRAKAKWAEADAEEARQKAEAEKEAAQAKRRAKIERLLGRSGIKKRFQQRTFANFIRDTPERRRCYDTAKTYADSFPQRAERGEGLYIEGTYGTGKTHLAAAIALQLIGCGVPVVCKTSGDLLADIKEAFDSGDATEYEIERDESVDGLRSFIEGKRGNETEWCDWNIPIHWGGMSDPFQPVEKQIRASYECLKLLAETKYPFVVSTKGRLIADPEYLDLLAQCNCVLQISMVCSKYDRLERGTPSYEERLTILKTVSARVQRTIVRIQPYMPEVFHDVMKNIPRIAEAGAYGVIVEGMKFFKAKPGMTKIGGDFCYPLPRLRHDFEAIKAECHRYGLKFYSGENRLRAMGDSMTCCGIDGLSGFRPNEYNLCMLMNGKNPEPTEKMKEVGTGGPFKTLNQSAGSGRKIAKQSFYGLMQEELAKKTDYHRKVFGLDE